MPVVETVPSKTILANKIILGAQQIRTLTFNSPSFPTREAGFEFASYFDQNIVFTGSQSDAVNIIISPAGSLGYSVIGWMPILWLPRIRTVSLGIQGFEIEAQVVMVPGSSTFADFIWASHRYLNVIDTTGLSADDRENYLMIPYNWSTYQNLVGPY